MVKRRIHLINFVNQPNTSIQRACFLFVMIFTFFAPSSYSDPGTDKLDKIATMICLEMAETKKFESARRVRLVNEFRINADLELFTEGDDKLIEYYEAGLCKTLLLESETDLKQAFRSIKQTEELKKLARASELMERAFERYEKELEACVPPQKVVRWVSRQGSYVNVGVRWLQSAEGCLLNYTYGMTQDEAQTQRVLYYLVELEGIDQPLIFSGKQQEREGERCFGCYRVGFGHKWNKDKEWWGFATSIYDPELKLGKKFKAKKDLKKITLVLAGDIKGYAGISQKMDLFGDGRKITKVVYEKD
jgi:hypothetical protein